MYIDIYIDCNCLFTSCDVMKFEINLFFPIKPFFLHGEKVITKKIKYLENKKSF